MLFFKKLNLQLFAEGEGGGEGAATGVEAVDPGQQRLRELGVPESKIRKNRQYKFVAPVQKPAAAEQVKTEGKETERVAAAEKPTEEAKTTRMTWEEILADPEYKKEYDKGVQSAVVPRIKNIKQAEDILKKVAPVLELQARRYGLDENNIDYDALVKATEKDSSYYEEKSLEKGTSIEQTMDEDIKDRAQKREQREQERTLEQQKIQNHILKLEQQGEAMKAIFPNFDLRKELQNPQFARMTAPNVGLSVEDAYYAVHRREIQEASMQVTAQKVAQKISNDIQSGKSRPAENGTTGQAPSVATFDYSKASREQREALKKRIRSSREKIYPGQEWK